MQNTAPSGQSAPFMLIDCSVHLEVARWSAKPLFPGAAELRIGGSAIGTVFAKKESAEYNSDRLFAFKTTIIGPFRFPEVEPLSRIKKGAQIRAPFFALGCHRRAPGPALAGTQRVGAGGIRCGLTQFSLSAMASSNCSGDRFVRASPSR